MKVFKRLLIGLLTILVIIGVASLFLPKIVYFSRFQTVAAPPELVFGYVNSLKKFNLWSPWAARDPNIRFEYSGPDEGVGASMSWQSENAEVGTGSQEIIESRANEFVKVSLNFGNRDVGNAHYTLKASGQETTITWAFEQDLGYNPVARYVGLMLEDWIAPDYETGLARLKTVVESAQNSSN